MIEPPTNPVLEEAIETLLRARLGAPAPLAKDAAAHFYAVLSRAWLLLAQPEAPARDQAGVTQEPMLAGLLTTTTPDGASWLPAFTSLDRLRARFPQARGYLAMPSPQMARTALAQGATRGVLVNPGASNAGALALNRRELEAVAQGGAPPEVMPEPAQRRPPAPPAAGDLRRIDSANLAINLPVVLLGSAAFDRFAFVVERVGGTSGFKQYVDVPRAPGEPSLRYAVLGLGSIRNHRIWAHLYAFEADPRITGTIVRHAAHAAGLVLAFAPGTDGTPQAGSVLSAIASVLPGDVPITILGDSALAKPCGDVFRREPRYAGPDIFEALKTVMKAALNQLKPG